MSAPYPIHWCLELVLVRGQDLPRTDVLGHCDPYVCISIGDNIQYKSATCYNTASPEYNEELWLEQVPAGTSCVLQVWDKDAFSRNDHVGTSSFQFRPEALLPPPGGPEVFGQPGRRMTSLELPLMGRGGTPLRNAMLVLQLRCWPCYSSPGPIIHRGPVSYRVSISSMAGALTGHMAEEGWLAFAAYKLQLVGVELFFPEGPTQPWNKDYDKARMIFQSSMAVAAVRMQHQMLYSDSGKTEQRGQLCRGADLVALLHGGVRQGQRRYYTYSILADRTMRFSETGAAFFTDMMSKHAMHANCAETVLYAGEFVLLPSEQQPGGVALFIDNNSGTYAPSKALLPAVRDLLQYNLPGLEVQVVAADDAPQLQLLHSLVPSRLKP